MQRSFYLFLSLACASYLGIQLFYTTYVTFGVDEFWFAHWIYAYKSGIPYRDFSPYKTVLGYYMLLPSMLLSHGLFTPLYSIKNTLAVLNTILFFLSARYLKQIFAKSGVLISIVMLMFTEFVFTYSTNIRVDFLAYWFCFFAALCLLEKKMFSAGVLLALGFLTSQKALWYIVACNLALGVNWLCYTRNWKYFRGILQFNITYVLTIFAYILFWASFSDWHVVLKNIFYDAYVMYKLDSYNIARLTFWSDILNNNPLCFMLWPVTLLSLILIPENDASYPARRFSIVLASTIMICLIFYKQPFPYYMLTTLPAFLLLYAAFFSWVLNFFSARDIKNIYFDKTGLWALIIFYFLILLVLKIVLMLSALYLFFALIPVIFVVYLDSLIPKNILRRSFWGIVIGVGLFSPLSLVVSNVSCCKSGAYQKNTLQLAEHLLKPGDDYIAGIELFYDKKQPVQSLRHLDVPGLRYLISQDKKLRSSMLVSLYHTPNASVPEAMHALEQAHVKLYVNNYRMEALPKKLKNYLATQYEHFWGSVYLYAPLVSQGNTSVNIKFTGQYQLESTAPVQVDHQRLLPNAKIYLTSGKHVSDANQYYRLKLIPDDEQAFLKVPYRDDAWEKMFF